MDFAVLCVLLKAEKGHGRLLKLSSWLKMERRVQPNAGCIVTALVRHVYPVLWPILAAGKNSDFLTSLPSTNSGPQVIMLMDVVWVGTVLFCISWGMLLVNGAITCWDAIHLVIFGIDWGLLFDLRCHSWKPGDVRICIFSSSTCEAIQHVWLHIDVERTFWCLCRIIAEMIKWFSLVGSPWILEAFVHRIAKKLNFACKPLFEPGPVWSTLCSDIPDKGPGRQSFYGFCSGCLNWTLLRSSWCEYDYIT